MVKLSQADMDLIINAYWPRTRSRTGLYKMLQKAADLGIQRLLQQEEKQEPVASYQLSAPIKQEPV